MAEIGSIFNQKYEIVREIGHGGMSRVYLAVDTHLKKQWAIKEIRKKGSKREDDIIGRSLLAEAELMKHLDHPALPRIVDILEEKDMLYLVMDYIEGESLDKVLREQGPQEEETVIEWAKQLCQVLSYLHTRKPPIIYRDMKPANVILRSEGMIKIVDFGIAGEYREEKSGDTLRLGTRGYAPPEQYRGQTDARSDIYALGMTMRQLLTGVDPGKETSCEPLRTLRPELSEGIGKIVDRCVELAPEKRYASCEELLCDLEHPELLDGKYRRGQKLKRGIFLTTVGMSLFFLCCGLICRGIEQREKKEKYMELAGTSAATAFEEKIERYLEAIELYPDRTEAYRKLLEAYEEEGVFGKEENDQFLALYNAHKEELKGAKGMAWLEYQAGMMYFNVYGEADEAPDFAARIQKAYGFFSELHQMEEMPEDFTKKEQAEYYYQICSFYKTYILPSATEAEASGEEEQDLLETVAQLLADTSDHSETGVYDQLVVYHGIFMLLYDQRMELAQIDRQQKSISMLDQIYERAKLLPVKKEQAGRLQQEMVEHYVEYREAMIRAFRGQKD